MHVSHTSMAKCMVWHAGWDIDVDQTTVVLDADWMIEVQDVDLTVEVEDGDQMAMQKSNRMTKKKDVDRTVLV